MLVQHVIKKATNKTLSNMFEFISMKNHSNVLFVSMLLVINLTWTDIFELIQAKSHFLALSVTMQPTIKEIWINILPEFTKMDSNFKIFHIFSFQWTKLGPKSYMCTTCNKEGNYKNNMIEHVRIHTGEKPFSCPFCLYKTACKSNLTKHSAKHSNESWINFDQMFVYLQNSSLVYLVVKLGLCLV